MLSRSPLPSENTSAKSTGISMPQQWQRVVTLSLWISACNRPMHIIISLVEKMREDPDNMDWRKFPVLLPRTHQMLQRLQELSYAELKALWKCSDSIAERNAQCLAHISLVRGLSPAVLAYVGIQYQYMEPHAFTDCEFAYIEEHLHIVSGFFGLLHPLDRVAPYRLEMQAELAAGNVANPYGFWGDAIARQLYSETDCVLNLASRACSMCISRHLSPSACFITCVFGQLQGGHVVKKGTLWKMARDEMVRYLVEYGICTPEGAKTFNRLGYCYGPALSCKDVYVFVPRKEAKGDGLFEF